MSVSAFLSAKTLIYSWVCNVEVKDPVGYVLEQIKSGPLTRKGALFVERSTNYQWY